MAWEQGGVPFSPQCQRGGFLAAPVRVRTGGLLKIDLYKGLTCSLQLPALYLCIDAPGLHQSIKPWPLAQICQLRYMIQIEQCSMQPMTAQSSPPLYFGRHRDDVQPAVGMLQCGPAVLNPGSGLHPFPLPIQMLGLEATYQCAQGAFRAELGISKCECFFQQKVGIVNLT